MVGLFCAVNITVMFRGVLKLEDQEYSKRKKVELEFTSQINLKGTVCVTSSDPPCKDDNARPKTAMLKP